MSALGAATAALFQRYAEIIEAEKASGVVDPLADDPYLSLDNLEWMCSHGSAHSDSLPIDKISRWLGCIQGCLAMRGLADLGRERDVSRPLFHNAYKASGIEIPSSRARDTGSDPRA